MKQIMQRGIKVGKVHQFKGKSNFDLNEILMLVYSHVFPEENGKKQREREKKTM